MWRAHNHVVLSEPNRRRKECVHLQCGYDRVVIVTCSWSCSIKRIESIRDVLISNVGMIEEYATWSAHNHVVVRELNRRRKGCVDLQCGHDWGVWNVLGEPNRQRRGCDEDITNSNMTMLMACEQKVNQSYIMVMVATFDELMLCNDVYLLSFSEINTWIKKNVKHSWKVWRIK
jgi:hypothetical protein